MIQPGGDCPAYWRAVGLKRDADLGHVRARIVVSRRRP
jgi:hypothetical protein